MSFEEALKKLEDVVKKLESGDISLDESLVLYEEAMKLSMICNKTLEEAKLKITELSNIEKGDNDE